MKASDYLLTAAVILAVVVAIYYFQPRDEEEQALELPPETAVEPVAVEAEEAEEAAIRYPVPAPPRQPDLPVEETPAAEPEPKPEVSAEPAAEKPAKTEPEKPLPTLDGSDDALRQELYALAAKPALESLFNLNRIIRRFVVTVDNLPGKHLLRSKYRSNQAIDGQLVVEKDARGYFLSEENFARYEPFVDLFESIDSDKLLALYVHYYPLIQAAYEDLGYPSVYFNDRLIDVIDHLLEAPDIGGRISLVRPHVLYKYADPELEGLSAGQKIFIRIGPENALRVKSKLRELRQALAGN